MALASTVWDANLYLKFADARTRPALDLMGRLDPANAARPDHAIYDLGCGAGNISRILAERFPGAPVVGIDSSEQMLDKARTAATEMGTTHVEFVETEAERLPFSDASFEVVISNGVIDLVPDKDAVFSELYRVLTPGGRMQIADVTIQRPVSEEGRRNIDLWTG